MSCPQLTVILPRHILSSLEIFLWTFREKATVTRHSSPFSGIWKFSRPSEYEVVGSEESTVSLFQNVFRLVESEFRNPRSYVAFCFWPWLQRDSSES